MAFTAGFSVNVGDPTKASDVDVLAANDDYLKNAIDTFIANDANNRVLTGTGSGTANAETNLTFDGSTLTVTGTVSATTFSGNVTGNLSGNVTGGTISGSTGTYSGNVTISKDAPQLIMTDSGSGGGTSDIIIDAIGSNHGFYFRADGATNHVILESNGDFKVDADTLFVDASADRVGINNNSPSTDVHIHSSSLTDGIRVQRSGFSYYTQLNPNGLTNSATTMEFDSVSSHLFKVGGVEKMRLDSSGSVGIGTNSPSSYFSTDLVVKASANGGGVTIVANGTTDYNNILFARGTSGNDRFRGQIQYLHSVDRMNFVTNTQTAMAIDSSQRVGIGTISPTTLLELSSSAGPEITIQRDDTSIVGSNVVGGIRFSSNDSSTAFGSPPHYGAGIKVKANGTEGLQNMSFYAGQNNLGYENDTPSMRLVYNGDVNFYDNTGAVAMNWDAPTSSLGIGTTSPSRLLHLSSTGGTFARFTSENTDDFSVGANANGFVVYNETDADYPFVITNTGNVGIGTASPTGTLQVKAATNSNLRFYDSSGRFVVEAVNDGVTNNTDLVISGENLDLSTNGASAIYIDSSQRVGISTNSPQRPLHIDGTEGVARFTSTASGNNGLEVGIGTSSQAFIWQAENSYLQFATNNVERLRITSDGKLCLNRTSGNTALNIDPHATGQPNIQLYNKTNDAYTYIKNDGSAFVIQNSYGTTAGFKPIQFMANGSVNLHIDEVGGSVGIGTSSPTTKFVVSDGGNTGLEVNPSHSNSRVDLFAYDRSASAYRDLRIDGEELFFRTGSTIAERLRIESTGVCAFMTSNVNIRFNGTATSTVLTDNNGVEIYTGGFIWAARQAASLYLNRAGSTGEIANFRYDKFTEVGSISVTSTATAYNTSSDYRLKENLVPITGAVDRVNALQPRRFNFISDPDTTVDGFVAHEVSPIVPEAISGEKDAVDEDGNPAYQGIDQSKLVPLLTAAIQELTARIEALEAA